MTKHVVSCDICKEEGASGRYFKVDRTMNGAGSMEDEYEFLDLCLDHQWWAYTLAQQFLTYEQVQRVVAALKGRRSRA